MKAVGFVILCVALIAGCIAVQAEDTADQAAARAALEQKLYELDHPAVTPASNSNPAVTATQPAESITTPNNAASTAPASTAGSDTGFSSNPPATNASAQAAALAAMQQKMNEMNQPPAGSPQSTQAAAAPVVVPVNEASASATPVTESPAAETPAAVAPAITSATVAPVSAAPAVVAPAPKVSAASASAAVAVVPAVNSESDAIPAQVPPARTLPTSSTGQVRPSNELVTKTGTTYKNVEVQRVTSDAIVISYTPAQGGWAMTKIDFRDLPPEICQEYGK